MILKFYYCSALFMWLVSDPLSNNQNSLHNESPIEVYCVKMHSKYYFVCKPMKLSANQDIYSYSVHVSKHLLALE